MGKIAIHGFGRIGRSLLKAALRDNLFVPYSISDIKDLDVLAALFKADSNYGLWPEEVRTAKDTFIIGGREIKYFDSSKSVPNWGELGVELVVGLTLVAAFYLGGVTNPLWFAAKTLLLLIGLAGVQTLLTRLRIDQTVGLWWRYGALLVLVQFLALILWEGVIA